MNDILAELFRTLVTPFVWQENVVLCNTLEIMTLYLVASLTSKSILTAPGYGTDNTILRELESNRSIIIKHSHCKVLLQAIVE